MSGDDSRFTQLLGDQVDDIEAPKPAPAGDYEALVTSYDFGESFNQKTPYCRMNIKPINPRESVDADQWEEFGGFKEDFAFKQDFWLTADAKFRLKNFLIKTLGLEGSGRTLQDLIPEAIGQALVITLGHRPSADGEVVYANITGMAAAD